MQNDTRETSLNFGTGEVVVRYQAQTIYGSGLLPENTIMKTIDGFTKIVKGIHHSVSKEEVPEQDLLAFEMFEASDNPPQIPYIVLMLEDK